MTDKCGNAAGHATPHDDSLPFQCDAWMRRVHKCTEQCDGCFRRQHEPLVQKRDGNSNNTASAAELFQAKEHVEQLRAALQGANARIDQLLSTQSERKQMEETCWLIERGQSEG